jgi:GT2 family glycosyltransferase
MIFQGKINENPDEKRSYLSDLAILPAKLDIIIINWNSGNQLRCCLNSIRNADRENMTIERVVVVDNASTDDSAKEFDDFSLPLCLKRNHVNRGFAAACNQGARSSKADYLLFLNPDVCLLRDSLTKPVKFMERMENEKAGILGIQLLDDKGQVSRTCSHFPTPGGLILKTFGLDLLFPDIFPIYFMNEWDHRKNRDVDHVMGAFFLMRRSLFQRLGGFDERFFVYFEDMDISYRASKAGWRSIYLAEAQAYHSGGGTSRQIKDKRLFYIQKSKIQYAYKHFSWCSATMVSLMTILLEPITRLCWATMRISCTEIAATIKGYLILWRTSPALLAEAWKRRKDEGTLIEPLQ